MGTVAAALTVLAIVGPFIFRYVVKPLKDHHKRLVALEKRLSTHIQRAHSRPPREGK
jgi:hypothetical protein